VKTLCLTALVVSFFRLTPCLMQQLSLKSLKDKDLLFTKGEMTVRSSHRRSTLCVKSRALFSSPFLCVL
jgi:hypothetical protein